MSQTLSRLLIMIFQHQSTRTFIGLDEQDGVETQEQLYLLLAKERTRMSFASCSLFFKNPIRLFRCGFQTWRPKLHMETPEVLEGQIGIDRVVNTADVTSVVTITLLHDVKTKLKAGDVQHLSARTEI